MGEVSSASVTAQASGGRPETGVVESLAAIDLNLLAPLLVLLEERSVTAAAGRIGMTQSALSHSLGRMRRLIGDELLVRQGSGMTLTPRALELIGPLRRALEQAREVVRPEGFDPESDRRMVTLTMTNSVAFALAEPIARLMAQRAPLVQLRLRTMPLHGPSDSVFTQEGVDPCCCRERSPRRSPANASTTIDGWSSLAEVRHRFRWPNLSSRCRTSCSTLPGTGFGPTKYSMRWDWATRSALASRTTC